MVARGADRTDTEVLLLRSFSTDPSRRDSGDVRLVTSPESVNRFRDGRVTADAIRTVIHDRPKGGDEGVKAPNHSSLRLVDTLLLH